MTLKTITGVQYKKRDLDDMITNITEEEYNNLTPGTFNSAYACNLYDTESGDLDEDQYAVDGSNFVVRATGWFKSVVVPNTVDINGDLSEYAPQVI
jgi:hypothetical protein